MGQIFNRFIRVAKSYIDDRPGQISYSSNSEDELRKIIDELNKDYDQKQEERRTYRHTQDNKQSAPPPPQQESPMNLDRACKLLSVPVNATTDEIKSAYKKRIMEYHPDRVATLGEELRTLASAKTQEINSAYNFLKNYKNF
jgi:DnaJ like chaperone protein